MTTRPTSTHQEILSEERSSPMWTPNDVNEADFDIPGGILWGMGLAVGEAENILLRKTRRYESHPHMSFLPNLRGSSLQRFYSHDLRGPAFINTELLDIPEVGFY